MMMLMTRRTRRLCDDRSVQREDKKIMELFFSSSSFLMRFYNINIFLRCFPSGKQFSSCENNGEQRARLSATLDQPRMRNCWRICLCAIMKWRREHLEEVFVGRMCHCVMSNRGIRKLAMLCVEV